MTRRGSEPIRYTFTIPLVDTRSIWAPPRVRPLGFDRLGSKIHTESGLRPFVREMGEIRLLENVGHTLPGGPRVLVNARGVLKLANQSTSAMNVVRSNMVDRRLIIEPDGVVLQLQMRGAWASRTQNTRVKLNDFFDAVFSLEVATVGSNPGSQRLEEAGRLASKTLARLTKSQDQCTGDVLSSRPILVVQVRRDAILDLPDFSGYPRVKLAHGTLVKVPRSGAEVYLLIKDHLPHSEDPLPTVLSLLHASVSALEHLMSDSTTSMFPMDASPNLLRRAQMNRLTLLNKLSGASEDNSWRARLFRFYSAVQGGTLENFQDRFTQADLQIQKTVYQIDQRTVIQVGDRFENINNSSIVNRSSNSSISINDTGELITAMEKLKEFESAQHLHSQLDSMISEAEEGKSISKIAQMWRTTSAGLPKIAAMGTIMTAIDRFLGTTV